MEDQLLFILYEVTVSPLQAMLAFHYRTLLLYRACRKTPLREIGASWPASALSTGAALTVLSVPMPFPPSLAARTRSRINLFRLQERIDRGPAISSVCHRRSLGLWNP